MPIVLIVTAVAEIDVCIVLFFISGLDQSGTASAEAPLGPFILDGRKINNLHHKWMA